MRKTIESNANRRREAAMRGDVHYVPTHACKQCDCEFRYVLSNQCVACTKARARKKDYEIRDIAKKARAAQEG